MGTGAEAQSGQVNGGKQCVIVAAGVLEACSEMWEHIGTGVYMICADGGYDGALRLGLKPDLFVGDMDSVHTQPKDCEMVLSPSIKDDTDTMLAVKLAIARGYSDITILGGLGGRLDHVIANLQTLVYCKKQGIKARLVGASDSAFVLTDEAAELPAREGFVSVFSVSERCEGVTLTGMKYPLQNAVVTNSFPVGVSNEFIGAYAGISVKKGCLLVVMSKERQ